jgi:hypothetical protein
VPRAVDVAVLPLYISGWRIVGAKYAPGVPTLLRPSADANPTPGAKHCRAIEADGFAISLVVPEGPTSSVVVCTASSAPTMTSGSNHFGRWSNCRRYAAITATLALRNLAAAFGAVLLTAAGGLEVYVAAGAGAFD